ncbi:zinc ribbon domain-containing protein [Altericroceibacterium spongiae]|uniref:Zinc ribbon domain-containing protein n=1 Tax=Altericroceibacterium spongiae TaxID=2320269 RepID=A0A420EQZ6_9SPHN|nr:zinc ribbon domain-containing protein [Altericroceibacterium spongiae]RKF23092.1 zinc ribbon domain-containing protein [Altericroceibacterium spongiae]
MTADEKTCPDCAENVKSAAKICRFCGHKFAEPGLLEQMAENAEEAAQKQVAKLEQEKAEQDAGLARGEKPKFKWMSGKGCLIVLAVLFGLVIISQISNPPVDPAGHEAREKTMDQKADSASALAESVDDNEVPPPADRSNWTYNENEDRMRGQTVYTASIRSENTVNFGFPYSGAQRMTIQLRKSPAHGNDVIFFIENGQIMCDVYDCIGAISFDGNTERLTLARSADNDSTIGFARYPEAIARKIKSADKVAVELSFYREGSRQFFFNTTNLQWDRF